MRKQSAYLAVALGSVSALLVLVGVAGGATAIQTIEGEFAPKKLPKNKYANGSIEVTVAATDADNPSGMPPKATRAEIFFDDDGRVNPSAVPTCSAQRLENTTTEAAKAACGNAQVGSGSAVAALPFGTAGRRDFPATVTAFNGEGGTLLLHSRVDDLGTTVVLVGEYKRASGDFGVLLDVPVPPLAGGVGAIASFNTKVKRGKYIQARCHDKDKTLDIDSRFTYSDAPQSMASDSQPCKVKKKKKGGGK